MQKTLLDICSTFIFAFCFNETVDAETASYINRTFTKLIHKFNTNFFLHLSKFKADSFGRNTPKHKRKSSHLYRKIEA
jgi:hypothetical protein